MTDPQKPERPNPIPDPQGQETLDLGDLADRSFGRTPWDPPTTPELRHGSRLAWGVLAAMVLSAVLVMVPCWLSAPSLDSALDAFKADSAEDRAAVLTAYIEARKNHFAAHAELAATLVTTLAPFFTLVAGYAFAKASENSGERL